MMSRVTGVFSSGLKTATPLMLITMIINKSLNLYAFANKVYLDHTIGLVV
ncbi:MAG: hypothetical protein U9N81_02675 [Bacillota bacterium]|nr:hypothetical protein [Bacillota bacterium]